MDYKYLNDVNISSSNFPESDSISPFLLNNNQEEIAKALSFFNTDKPLLYVHGFLGTGKRQFISYITEFFNNDVIKLEYFCKPSTVFDDILISFISILEQESASNTLNNANATTLHVKFESYLSSIKKPFVIILHYYDDILEINRDTILKALTRWVQNSNVKLITSTRAMSTELWGEIEIGKKIFLRGFSKEKFKEFINSYNISCTDTVMEDFYKYTRGYYYYTDLALKIVKAMQTSLSEFLNKYTLSGMKFDAYLGFTYVNLVPTTIRNFFWFLCSVRHGVSLNAMAVWGLYDEFALEYLKKNGMIFQIGEIVFVQNYFQECLDLSIPEKTEVRLRKYIISIYEKQLQESIATREIKISRQSLQAEIEYHNKILDQISNKSTVQEIIIEKKNKPEENVTQQKSPTLEEKFAIAKKNIEEKKYAEAVENFLEILDSKDIDCQSFIEARRLLAGLYKKMGEYEKAQHYYELVEATYKKNNEVINLSYLYYELTDLYFLMYKTERAITTIKKVIYSVDTPASLLVMGCVLLGNIYSVSGNSEEALQYYEKALQSVDENTEQETINELYFKYALANDDMHNESIAFEYYTKCIYSEHNNKFKALAYSNMGACYYDHYNYSDAKACFLNAYNIEKSNNNYEGIYYNISYLAKIGFEEKDPKTLEYLLEAKQCAEFINEDFYLLESSLSLGDYYYDNPAMSKEAVIEYLRAKKLGETLKDTDNLKKIQNRINDMRLRMSASAFNELEKKYG